ncbi:MAG: hypothetical protein P1V81_10550 [Planctomycetota bacterium]|nr:hypothetical protein [Planctomycetota bacterium]
MPSPEHWVVGETRLILDDWNIGTVSAKTDTKTVFVSWEHLPQSPSIAGKTQVNRKYTTSFWPTAIAGSGLELFVAGRDFSGDTIIERWTFEAPTSPPTQAVALRRHEPVRLYADDVAGRRDVIELAVMVGLPSDLLAQFDDSRELWKLNTPSGAWTKLASPTDGSVLVVPELLSDWPLFHVRRHASEGGFYTLGHPWNDVSITMVDGDLDGVLDECRVLSTEQWHAAGYDDAASYLSVFPY